MTLSTFDPGDKLFFSRTFTKAEGQSGTPSSVTVTLTLIDPAGATTTPSVSTSVSGGGVATATANTTISAANTAAGMWYARWVASGDIIAVEEESFYVRTSPVL